MNPEEYQTLCGVIYGKRWAFGNDTLSDVAATCLPCRAELAQRQRNVSLNNVWADEGVDRCECGCKCWENDHCIDCGAEWGPETRVNDD